MPETTKDPGGALWFRVSVDGNPIGTFTECQGPTITREYEELVEGGNHGMVIRLFKRLKFSNVRLTRAVNEDTPKIIRWFTDTDAKPSQVMIEGLAANRFDVVVKYTLVDAVPLNYKGADFSTKNSSPAMESIEIAYSSLS